MPLHLKELQKHTEQNNQIIALLQQLITIQQPKKEVVSNITEGVKKNVASRKPKSSSTRKRITNSNAI